MTRDSAGITAVLADLIRLDTSNPPGNEEVAVQYIEAMLARDGIKSEIYMPEPKRANILARIKGKNAGEPVVLLGHLDVVPARDEGWTEGPFSGAVRDGYLYGRGAIDMKSQIAAFLLAFLDLHRSGATPERDIVFLATADEETSGRLGVEYLLGKVKELRNTPFVLSEGGFILEKEGMLHARISVAEKMVCQFMLRAEGPGGHGSMPRKDSANNKIVRAAERIIAAGRPLKPTPIVSAYLNGIMKGKKIGSMTFSNLRNALAEKRFRDHVENDPVLNALLTNTVALTMLKSGDKVNVIPPESTAQFDARILPSEKHERFIERIRKIAGREVEVTLTGRTDSLPSPFRTPYFSAITEAVRKAKGNIAVLPFLTTGATDLRHFRALGSVAYGFAPFVLSDEDQMRMHGVNERISVRSLEEGLTITKDIVTALAVSVWPGWT